MLEVIGCVNFPWFITIASSNHVTLRLIHKNWRFRFRFINIFEISRRVILDQFQKVRFVYGYAWYFWQSEKFGMENSELGKLTRLLLYKLWGRSAAEPSKRELSLCIFNLIDMQSSVARVQFSFNAPFSVAFIMITND